MPPDGVPGSLVAGCHRYLRSPRPGRSETFTKRPEEPELSLVAQHVVAGIAPDRHVEPDERPDDRDRLELERDRSTQLDPGQLRRRDPGGLRDIGLCPACTETRIAELLREHRELSCGTTSSPVHGPLPSGHRAHADHPDLPSPYSPSSAGRDSRKVGASTTLGRRGAAAKASVRASRPGPGKDAQAEGRIHRWRGESGVCLVRTPWMWERRQRSVRWGPGARHRAAPAMDGAMGTWSRNARALAGGGVGELDDLVAAVDDLVG